MSSGQFIAFEGGEGVGKSTQLRRLAAWLRERGHDVVETLEPGGTTLGTAIRSLVLDDLSADVSPRAEALLYAADRAHHVATVVRPALEAGRIVLTDRYIDSSLAYQGAGRDLAHDDVRRLSSWATGGLLPDLTLVLDLPPAVGLSRARGSAGGDRIESEALEFHERVRAAFLEFARAEPSRYAVIDASAQIGAVAEAVRDKVAALLQLTGEPA